MSFYKTPLKYGATVIDEFIPKTLSDVTVLQIEEYKPDFSDFENKLNEVLANPIGSKPFDDLVREIYSEGKIVMFIVDDNTRPNIHTRILFPILTARLYSLGVRKEDIRIIIASGTHKKPTPEAIKNRILGSLYEEWKDNVLIHDCDSGNRNLGKTKKGAPILIDEQVLNASLLIPLSDSEYHYFAGQAGTVKLFCPGVAGRETIRVNHPRMFDVERGFVPGCRLGNTQGNPVIQEMIEIATSVKQKLPMFCVDTIVHHGEIVYVQAGDLIECHKAASDPLYKLRVVEVDEPGDIVFVSVGELGLNLYQAGKGVHAAWNAVRHDMKGWIVLLAPCQEGIGSAGYEESMNAVKDMMVKDALKFVVENYGSEQTFKIGNQKPPDLFRILLDVAEHNIKVVTQHDPKELRDIYRMDAMNPEDPADAQRVLREITERFVKENPDIPNPKVYVLDDPGLLIEVKNR
ncbi:MAG: lactate racemase domain-containing protein [Candidatus Thorarchaeota archaeon]|jgi:nickel-dependent lactate racemase